MTNESSTPDPSRATSAQHSALSTQHFVVLALSLLVAATRLLAASKSIWDWDEALFCMGVHDYNVVAHHPHPPGFPLFVAVAKLFRLVIADDFHALRAVSLLASMFLFPALYALARAIGFSFRSAVLGALLYAFLPNVWYHGGTAFSDVFAIALALGAAAMLFGGTRTRYFVGSVLFAATLLVRVQNVLFAYAWFVGSWRRHRAGATRDVFASAALITALVLGGYGLAARATGGWKPYWKATRDHQHYVTTVDGPANPARPAPMKILREFAVDPFHAHRVMYLFCALGALALLRPRRRQLDVILLFAPNFFLAWLMLSVSQASRFSVGYFPMHALLAVDGMALVAALIARRRELYADVALTAGIAGVFAIWAWPALAELRQHDSPPVAAARWVQQHVPRAGSKLYIGAGMVPFADYFLSGYDTQETQEDFDPTAVPEEANAFYLADTEFAAPRAIVFRRPRKRLFFLFTQRYFEASVVPVSGGPQWKPGKVDFVDGWYPVEIDTTGRPYRWMGMRSRTLLESLPQRGALTLLFFAPLDVEPSPEVTVAFNGRVIERFHPDAQYFRRDYPLDSIPGKAGEFVISVDRVVSPRKLGKGDPRDLGLRVSGVSWKALQR